MNVAKIAMGVDPGIQHTGYGIVRVERGAYSLAQAGVVVTGSKEEPAERLWTIQKVITTLLEEHKPDIVCVESVFFNRNVSSAVSTGMVIGVVSALGAGAGIPVEFVTPQAVKSAVGARRDAGKAEIEMLVKRLLKVELKNHAADAAACGLCGLLSLRKPTRIFIEAAVSAK